MNLTKEQAVEEHRKMWRIIAAKTIMEQKIFKPEDYLEEYYSGKIIYRNSFCCEYANLIMNENCDSCPVDWKSTADRYMCEDKDNNVVGEGFLDQWIDAVNCEDYRKAGHYAALIAELPERDVETKEVIKQEKPPVGVKPYYILSGERISDLAGAIQRYSRTKKYKIIKLWAKEIICHCDLIKKLSEQETK